VEQETEIELSLGLVFWVVVRWVHPVKPAACCGHVMCRGFCAFVCPSVCLRCSRWRRSNEFSSGKQVASRSWWPSL